VLSDDNYVDENVALEGNATTPKPTMLDRKFGASQECSQMSSLEASLFEVLLFVIQRL
jgi:hypothetical protein